MINQSRTLRYLSVISEARICTKCQYRLLRTSATHNGSKITPPSPLAEASSTKDEEHNPKPLNRPIGLATPPKAGQNSGLDTRTWRQRRSDFLNYDKHIERRKQLTKQVAKPYFREWTNMRHHKGKSFLSNPKLFRAERALYFPNLHGVTLASPKTPQDTTPVLKYKISVVSVFSSTWAERQVATFISENENAELHQVLKQSPQVTQRVNVNIEENALKAGLIRLFMPSIRRRISKDAHGRYFVVRRGMTDDIRDAIGLLNGKVGYVYLVDEACRIRWAGSGKAEGDEKEGLVRGVKRLLEEWTKNRQKVTAPPVEAVEDEVPKAAAAA
ncbi:MAG: Mitochondrial ATPase complex subunit atp10 [Pycnora praestabilis]|nr:MAG: Mitochondrial ATPase complex subunit atp10 [Pycnora praestabilis]